jgi:hypothetical protein
MAESRFRMRGFRGKCFYDPATSLCKKCCQLPYAHVAFRNTPAIHLASGHEAAGLSFKAVENMGTD